MKTVARHLPFFPALLLIFTFIFHGGLRAQSVDIHNFDGGGTYMDPYLVGSVGTAQFGDFGLGDAGVSRQYSFTTVRTADASSVIVLTFRTSYDDPRAGYIVRLQRPRPLPLPAQTIGSTFYGDAGYYRFSGYRQTGVQNGEFRIAVILPVNGLEPGTYHINVSRTTEGGLNGDYEVLLQFPPLDTTYTLSPANRSVGPASTAGSLTLTTAAGNAWSAVSQAPSWLAVLAPTSGSGSATINYSVVAYTGTGSRIGQITAGGQTFVLTQTAAAAGLSISPSSRSHSSRATTAQTIGITTSSGVDWYAWKTAPWIVFEGNHSGTGSGTCRYGLLANTTSSARTARIVIETDTAEESFLITQAADDGLNPPTILQAPAGGIVLSGDPFVLSVLADGSPALAYQWSRNGTPIAGATSATYRVAFSLATHAGAYTVRISNSAGQVTTPSVAIAVGASDPWLAQPVSIPGLIQAADFNQGDAGIAYHDNTPANAFSTYRSSGVDVETTSDTGGGYDIASIEAGEWVSYAINVGSAGRYTVELRSAGTTDAQLHLEIDGQNISGPITLRETDGADTWVTTRHEMVHLPQGQKSLRVVWDSVNAPSRWAVKLRSLRFVAEKVGTSTRDVQIDTSYLSMVTDPYPTTIYLDGAGGPIVSVEVTLSSLRHEFAADLDILLTHGNEQVMLLSDWGGGSNFLSDLTFADNASSTVPATMQPGRWRPSANAGSDTFPYPYPGGSYTTTLSTFTGTDPNGSWKLWIVDDTPDNDTGTLDGWSVRIGWLANHAPVLSAISPMTLTAGGAPVSVPLSFLDGETSFDALLFSVTSSDETVLNASRVTFTGTGANRSMLVSASGAAGGKTMLTVTVTDGSGATASRRVPVTVTPANTNIAVGVDQSAVTWTTGGDNVWFVQTATTNDGVDAVESGYLAANQSAWFETTVTGPDIVRFWWKQDAGSTGWTYFAVDESIEREINGSENSWQEAVWFFPAGTHTLRWTYSQDVAPGATPSRAWVDRITFDSRVYDNWAAANVLTGADAALTADPDRDGISNLLEFGCNLLPTVSRNTVLAPGTGLSGLPSLRLQGTGSARRLTLEYLRRKNSGLTYTAQFSDTPASAGWQAATGTPIATQIDATWERVVIADTFTAAQKPKRFGRVVVAR